MVGPLASTTSEYSWSNLKSATTYTLTLFTCSDDSCSTKVTVGDAATATTAEEFWQVHGGNSYDTATHVVDHGSALSYVYQYESHAGSPDNVTLLYFHPRGSSEWKGGIRIAESSSSGAAAADLTHFNVTGSGLGDPCTDSSQNNLACATGDSPYSIEAFQLIPQISGVVRLYFNAATVADLNAATRIYYLDSQDGYLGLDFDQDLNSSKCEGAEFAAGGSCASQLLLGVDGDQPLGSPLTHARQFKIGYPMLQSVIWDESEGTFMVITGADSCGQTDNGLFLANYMGNNQWQVAEEDGCAKPLVRYGHGPVIVHLGGDRYKFYYEYEADSQGTFSRDEKPLRMVYIDAGIDGKVTPTEIESETAARDVNFLWADGTLLTAAEERGLGDHVIHVADKDLNHQVMYMNLGGFDNQDWGEPSSGIGMALLLNP
ncbi:MAG: hypothetical protein HQL48_01955 [Gammaproteobacteria bacterium]|nr:hypothetical protein [Gammaproteobacteria bacterium]